MSLASYLRYALPSWWSLAWSSRPRGRVAVLSTVWPHHARRSGYHPVAKGLGMALRAHGLRLAPAGVSRRRFGDGLDKAYQIALAMRLAGRDCLLVIDGDFQLRLIESLRRVTRARIVAVFHQIPAVLKQSLSDCAPGLLDGAVCVARCQIPLVEPLAPQGRTWFIPHGVDTEYFTPGGARSAQPSVLCVGCHCRDFETLRQSAQLIQAAVPGTSVRLIAPRAALPAGLKLWPVELLSGLTDAELLQAYRQSWVVLLPLTDSTANNSLLEAMACGTPVVVTDVGGVRDYAGAECGALCPPQDAQAHATATIEMLMDAPRREAASRASRARAQHYAWPRVREQIRRVLDTAGEQPSPP